jgi:tRNA(Ile)-lysidine synthase
MARLLAPAPFAIAVSGGGDSVALMLLTADWLREHRKEPGPHAVLIVDHGLRNDSAKEATLVAEWATRAGFKSHILNWHGSKPRSDVEAQARNARYALLGEWCRKQGVAQLLVAHTRDDQAETFLLRLGRGSGVDGLSSMSPRAAFPLKGYDGIQLIRPLLAAGRSELREFLAGRGTDWLEDPMNADSRFARARVRELLPRLESAGVSTSRIAQAAAHLARAREALDEETRAFLERHSRFGTRSFLLDGRALKLIPREIGLRALSVSLMRVGEGQYRPRFERLEQLYDGLISGNFTPARTLSGCRVGLAAKAQQSFGPATLEIRREGPRKSRFAATKTSADCAEPALKTDFVTRKGAKLPKKGRIIPLPFNS